MHADLKENSALALATCKKGGVQKLILTINYPTLTVTQ